MTAQRIAEDWIVCVNASSNRAYARFMSMRSRMNVFGEKPDERVWLATSRGEVAVYFDESRSEFGLGSLGTDGSIRDRSVFDSLASELGR